MEDFNALETAVRAAAMRFAAGILESNLNKERSGCQGLKLRCRCAAPNITAGFVVVASTELNSPKVPMKNPLSRYPVISRDYRSTPPFFIAAVVQAVSDRWTMSHDWVTVRFGYGIWLTRSFPSAVQVVNLYHAKEKVWDVAELYPE